MKKHPRLKWWLVRTGIVAGLIAVVILVALLVQSLLATQKLKTVHTRLEQESIPLSWSELYDVFPNAEAHLAAQSRFFTALDDLTNLPDLSDEEREVLPVEGYAELPEIGNNLPPDMISALIDRLRDAGPELEAIRLAVADEPFWLDPPTNTFNFPTLSRLASVRQAARLFNMSAILYSERAEPAAATQAVLDGLRLAKVLRRGSLVIDELVRVACDGIALHSLEHVLAKTDPSEKSLNELQDMLSERSDMRTGLMGEIVYTKHIYGGMSDLSQSEMQKMIEFSAPQHLQHLVTYLPVPSGWIRMNEAYHLERLHHVVDTWHLPWQDFTNRCAEVSDAVPWPYFLANQPQEMYTSVKSRELRAAGAWRCGRVAIAIKRYSQEHGNLPAFLTDLVPMFIEDLPAEPFYGQPFVYTNDGKTGTLRFAYPDSDRDFTFKLFAQ